MNWGVVNSSANSGLSVGASSLVTDANSALSGGPHLQRSASINTDSYMRLPASPMSFSSNNISISGSSAMDGSSIVQQSPHQDQSSHQVQQRHQGASSATSQMTPRAGQVALPNGPQFTNSLTHDPNYLAPMPKKPRLDIKREDGLPQQVIQQLLHRQDALQLQGQSPQLQALLQHQRLLQRHHQPQQILQSMPQIQRAQLQQLQQQQLRHLQQQGIQPISVVKRPYESGVCARRLMQYIYHQRHRDNTIVYWRKFVAEYFTPRAKKRWCLSQYDNVGQHALGVFPQAAMDAWQCDICGSKSGRGFEATYEVLPRLKKVKFDSGVLDELLFLDMPRECRFPSGIMMLEYGKAVQESVYEQLRVVREGQLRIIFTPDLKILSWEFCARHHEELFPRRVLAPQVNQLLQVAQKYQATVSESGPNGPSSQDLQANCNMFLTAGRQLVRNLESQSLNDLGFSKRYVRCLQISEVVNSMKDLIDFSRDQTMGPIECLKSFPRQAAAAKLQMQKMQEIEQQQAIAQGLTHDRAGMSKVMAMHPGLGAHINSNNQMVGTGVLNNSAQNAVALSNYQNLLRQNSMNSNPSMNQQEPSCSFNGSNQAQSAPFQGPPSSVPGALQNVQANGFTIPHQPQQQLHQHVMNSNILQQGHQQPSQGNQNLQQHMIQQFLRGMMNNSGGGRVPQPQQLPFQSLGAHTNGTAEEDGFDAVNGNIDGLPAKPGSAPSVANGVGYGKNTSAVPNGPNGITNGLPNNRTNSFKATSNANANDTFNSKTNDILQNLHLPEMSQDIAQEFADWDV
ncbi:hypothetical protein Scep_006497 [Stephania cephalantha]|uniref:Transcriptional regulator SLK2 n=2 Tax=Stephania cephalantha TaxID=152367 RepID=A0AAP0K9B0_9MAGN